MPDLTTKGPGDASPREPEQTTDCCLYGFQWTCARCEVVSCSCGAVDAVGCEPCLSCLRRMREASWPLIMDRGAAVAVARGQARDYGRRYAITPAPMGGWYVVPVDDVAEGA